MKRVNLKEWLDLSINEKYKIRRSWKPFSMEGINVIQGVLRRIRRDNNKNKDIIKIDAGPDCNGYWELDVTLKVGNEIFLPKDYLGIPIQKFYWGLNRQLKKKLTKDYGNNFLEFFRNEKFALAKTFPFLNEISEEKAALFLKNFVNSKQPPGLRKVNFK